MCSVCLQTPCDSRCPNAADPKAVDDCILCNHPIIPGEEYGKINGLCYCESCLDDMPLSNLITLCGAEWHTLEDEDEEDYAVIDGKRYEESVLEDMPFCELIPMLDGEWNTASEEDYEDGCYWED